ncbi:MAG: hypothetical protein JNM22_18645 [Saprospiraceae bacterium]|nr:hypothetical protein [Saprospiraceae bacterium]
MNFWNIFAGKLLFLESATKKYRKANRPIQSKNNPGVMGAAVQPEQKPDKITRQNFIQIGTFVILLLSLLFYLYRPSQKAITADQKSLEWDDVAYFDEQGEPQLKDWRLKEFDKQVEEFEQAEQYVLLAKSDGIYVCYHCNSGTCFLQKGMVWKYGVTRRGVSRRYPGKWLTNMGLDYVVQFLGTTHECLIEEKRKIFQYPLHLDNLFRTPVDRMARPPGNKNDN